MGTRPRWVGSLVRRRPYAAIATGACVIAAAGSALILVPQQAGHRPRALAADCGIVTRTATIPPRSTASAAASPSPSPRPVHSATQSMDFTAQGNTTSPATCTLNGAPCG